AGRRRRLARHLGRWPGSAGRARRRHRAALRPRGARRAGRAAPRLARRLAPGGARPPPLTHAPPAEYARTVARTPVGRPPGDRLCVLAELGAGGSAGEDAHDVRREGAEGLAAVGDGVLLLGAELGRGAVLAVR